MSHEMNEFQSYSDADKLALWQLSTEVRVKIGTTPATVDLIAAVTPSLPTPAQLRGI